MYICVYSRAPSSMFPQQFPAPILHLLLKGKDWSPLISTSMPRAGPGLAYSHLNIDTSEHTNEQVPILHNLNYILQSLYRKLIFKVWKQHLTNTFFTDSPTNCSILFPKKQVQLSLQCLQKAETTWEKKHLFSSISHNYKNSRSVQSTHKVDILTYN